MKNTIIYILFAAVVYWAHVRETQEREPARKTQGGTSKIAPVEARGRIAVLDSGLGRFQINKKYMCKDMPVFTIAGDGFDHDGHGTNIVGIIAENMDSERFCITSYSIPAGMGISVYNFYLHKMTEHNVVGVNISMSGQTYDQGERDLLQRLINKGAKVFVAAGNERNNLDKKCNAFPACLRHFMPELEVVGNKKDYKIYSNYGSVVSVWADGVKKGFGNMTGSSQSTALATGIHFSK